MATDGVQDEKMAPWDEKEWSMLEKVDYWKKRAEEVIEENTRLRAEIELWAARFRVEKKSITSGSQSSTGPIGVGGATITPLSD